MLPQTDLTKQTKQTWNSLHIYRIDSEVVYQNIHGPGNNYTPVIVGGFVTLSGMMAVQHQRQRRRLRETVCCLTKTRSNLNFVMNISSGVNCPRWDIAVLPVTVVITEPMSLWLQCGEICGLLWSWFEQLWQTCYTEPL